MQTAKGFDRLNDRGPPGISISSIFLAQYWRDLLCGMSIAHGVAGMRTADLASIFIYTENALLLHQAADVQKMIYGGST